MSVPNYRPMVSPPKGYGSRTRPPVSPLGGSTPSVTAFPTSGGEMVLAQGGAGSPGFFTGPSIPAHPSAGGLHTGPSSIPAYSTMQQNLTQPASQPAATMLPEQLTKNPVSAFMNPMGHAQSQMQMMNPMGSNQGQVLPPAPVPGTAYQQADKSRPEFWHGAYGGTNPSAVQGTSSAGGYVYDSNQQSPMDPRTAAWVVRTRAADQAAGTGPYDNAYGRFERLQGPQQSQMTPPPAGRTYGGGTTMVQMPDGRMVGVGPRLSQDVRSNLQTQLGREPTTEELNNEMVRAYQQGASIPQSQGGDEAARVGEVNAARGGHMAYRSSGEPINGYVPGQEEKRNAAIQRQRDRRDQLRAGRNIRANRDNGAPLRPDMYPGGKSQYDRLESMNPATAGSSGSNNPHYDYKPGDTPTTPDADRELALNNAESALPTDLKEGGKYGLIPSKATVRDVTAAYLAARGNMSPQDKQSYKNWIGARARKDRVFREEFDAWAKETKYVASTYSPANAEQRRADFEAQNELRASLGLKPLEWVENQISPAMPTGF